MDTARMPGFFPELPYQGSGISILPEKGCNARTGFPLIENGLRGKKIFIFVRWYVSSCSSRGSGLRKEKERKFIRSNTFSTFFSKP
jgi:hypothetical protein